MNKPHIFLLAILLFFSRSAFSQDTIYTATNILSNVLIRDNQPGFIEYRFADDEEKRNLFIEKKYVLAWVKSGGFHEVFVRNAGEQEHSVYYIVDEKGDTIHIEPSYDPMKNFTVDSTVKLCRLKKDNEYNRLYGARNHFYFNDSEKKFFNCAEIIYEGIDYSCMKLVNMREVSKASLIKNRYMPRVAEYMSTAEAYMPFDFGKKKLVNDMRSLANSYKALDELSWVCESEYKLDAQKIPSFIKAHSFEKKEGIGLLFLVEKFSKTAHELSGYWVVFDFATRKTLLMDYIVASGVGSQSNGYGWESYWQTALVGAGIDNPSTLYRYLELQKKGEVELVGE